MNEGLNASLYVVSPLPGTFLNTFITCCLFIPVSQWLFHVALFPSPPSPTMSLLCTMRYAGTMQTEAELYRCLISSPNRLWGDLPWLLVVGQDLLFLFWCHLFDLTPTQDCRNMTVNRGIGHTPPFPGSMGFYSFLVRVMSSTPTVPLSLSFLPQPFGL